jgi:hypothetical protein
LGIDAQVPDVVMSSSDEKDEFHLSKKKRNAPSALNKKRKDLALYREIVEFDYDLLKSLEEEQAEEFEQTQQDQKSWPCLVGRVR